MVCQGKIRGVELFMILVRVLVESLGNVSLDLCREGFWSYEFVCNFNDTILFQTAETRRIPHP